MSMLLLEITNALSQQLHVLEIDNPHDRVVLHRYITRVEYDTKQKGRVEGCIARRTLYAKSCRPFFVGG